MPFTHQIERHKHRIWSAAVVLMAICAITVGVTTRYSAPLEISSHVVKTVKTHNALDSKRQRLNKTAAEWMPPVLSVTVFSTPSVYPRITPTAPAASSRLVSESLYNRPPPSV